MDRHQFPADNSTYEQAGIVGEYRQLNQPNTRAVCQLYSLIRRDPAAWRKAGYRLWPAPDPRLSDVVFIADPIPGGYRVYSLAVQGWQAATVTDGVLSWAELPSDPRAVILAFEIEGGKPPTLQ